LLSCFLCTIRQAQRIAGGRALICVFKIYGLKDYGKWNLGFDAFQLQDSLHPHKVNTLKNHLRATPSVHHDGWLMLIDNDVFPQAT
jgi:hypothetical protein